MLVNPQTILVKELQKRMYLKPSKKPHVPAKIINIIIQNVDRTDIHLYHYPLGYATVVSLGPDEEITIYERV